MRAILVSVAVVATMGAACAPVFGGWETIASPPFPHGVSAGGGLVTDGQYIYAADLSGDGNSDFIDLNDNGVQDTGELLQDLGIANGSVRFARYDPVAESWEALPTLEPTGVGGDNFSAGNLNRPLFHADGFLYYYQLRSGPNRCVLHRYDLASAPAGAWVEVWDKGSADALLTGNAGMVGVDAPGGPVILHHRGGGTYEFVRTSGLDSGGMHEILTPNWPFTGAHFPRNGCWEYDGHSGQLYHMSGNQLVRWTPSSAYHDASFLTSVPQAGTPLAEFDTVIPSLKDTLGWDPGGSHVNPGASLWGNSLVMVNEPTGQLSGPNGEDTGANVLYMVRGESSDAGWPFTEGRGLVTNGDFARYFPATGATQTLSPAPFSIGKGSDAVYLDGFVYVTQGETRPGAGGGVTSGDGIRRPGDGFARFHLAGDDTDGPLLVPVGDYLRDGFASLAVSAHASGSPEQLFDGDWASACTSDGVNPMVVTVTFAGPTTVGAARAAFTADAHRWSLEAADSESDLAGQSGSYVAVFGPEDVSGTEAHWKEWNATPVRRRVFRFNVERLAGGPSVEIRELELQYPKPVYSVEIGGLSVLANFMQVVPDTAYLRVTESQDLVAEVSLSLGPDRHDASAEATWTSSNPGVATVNGGTVAGVGVGTATIKAAFGEFEAEALVSVVDPQTHDDDFSVAWIQRLPVMDYVWDSAQPDQDGWPAVGSTVTWRARVKSWWPYPREDVAYRWLLDGTVVAEGLTDLGPKGYTDVDLPWTWTFDRHVLRFEIDPANAVAEFSETNNVVETWTDAITVAFWVEEAIYDHFHAHQKELGIGSNGWEDWAQRQVARWNAMFASVHHRLDAPDGVLDRIRLDKITVVSDGALPLSGGLPTNNPDNSDRTTDLVWGFPATGIGMYSNHTDTVDSNPFYFEGSLIHELGHARYLIDVYGFNVFDREDNRRVLIMLDGAYVAGTPYMPRTWQWWDHVYYFAGWSGSSSFQGLMNSLYTRIDRYSAAAFNLIAGHRATRGNSNAPGNIGEFFNDLPDQNTIQLVDWKGQPIPNAVVSVYQATAASDWYGKTFDDVVDASFTADANGLVQIGRNPFTDGEPLRHTYGISHAVAILRVEAAGMTGFAFLPAAWFNLEYWRGNTTHGHYELTVHMIGDTPSIASVVAWPDGAGRRLRIVAGGTSQPTSVVVDGVHASYQHGAWWVASPNGGTVPSQITSEWTGGPVLTETYQPDVPMHLPEIDLSWVNGALRLEWQSRPGYHYFLQHSDNLIDWYQPGWSGDLFGTGSRLEVDDVSGGDLGFSRLGVLRLNE